MTASNPDAAAVLRSTALDSAATAALEITLGSMDAAQRVAYAMRLRASMRTPALAAAGTHPAAEAAGWAHAMRDDLRKAAEFTDRLSADFAGIHNLASRRIVAAQLDASRTGTLGRFFDPYAAAVHDFDLEAAHWVRERDTRRAQGVTRWLCKA